MTHKPDRRTDKISSILQKIAEAGLLGDRQRLELLCINAIRSLRSDFPDIAQGLGETVANCSVGSPIRAQLLEPPPSDSDEGLALVKLEANDDAERPVLEQSIASELSKFIEQREKTSLLLTAGVNPPRSLLLKGAPGTGKTMIAKWVARETQLPLIALDLASSISSFLGKTGGNLKKSLDYARLRPCVLLLDEFDAIAKRRDDVTEIGELKRIVNVLLKELEYWPLHSILIAATNHPELLDPAINRRFDVVLTISLPGKMERLKIFQNALGGFLGQIEESHMFAMAILCEGLSGSEIHRICGQATRDHIINDAPLLNSLLQCVPAANLDLSDGENANFLRDLQRDTKLTVRELAQIFHKSPSTIQYHLKR